jgi:hypothetical protein
LTHLRGQPHLHLSPPATTAQLETR